MKYSSEYRKYRNKISFWLFKITKTKKYYPNDYHYREASSKYNDILVYHNLIKEAASKNPQYASKPIELLKGISAENTTQKKIKSKFGKPDWIINHKKYSYTISILFYRIFLGEYKVKLEFHFANNELFFYNYYFSYLKEHDRNKLLKILEKKYLNNNIFEWNNNSIVDENNSMITLQNNINFQINYIIQNKNFFNKIEEIQTQQKLKSDLKKKTENRELFETL